MVGQGPVTFVLLPLGATSTENVITHYRAAIAFSALYGGVQSHLEKGS